MEDLKLFLETLIARTEDSGKDKPYLTGYIKGKIEAFNLILEYVYFQIEKEKM